MKTKVHVSLCQHVSRCCWRDDDQYEQHQQHPDERHQGDTNDLMKQQEQEYLGRGCEERSTVNLLIHPRRSRIVWNILRPIFFEDGDKHVSRALLVAILQQCRDCGILQRQNREQFSLNNCLGPRQNSTRYDEKTNEQDEVTLDDNCIQGTMIFYASFEFSSRRGCRKRRRRGKTSSAPSIISIRIQPPYETPVQHAYESRLIKLEHDMIRAQTAAGYLSTLGGAYFMCAHFDTATKFAMEQAQVAAQVLNNRTMYHKCMIYQAYNHIYNKQFETAVELLHCVKLESNDTVVRNMADSALLFCRRVSDMAHILIEQNANISNDGKERQVDQHKQQQLSDDFGRIRLVKDRSRQDDLIQIQSLQKRLPLRFSSQPAP